ncbi:MAG: hypothetical protein V1806_03780 [Pseudomonadota bacterium]
MAKSAAQIRDEIPKPDKDGWAGDFYQVVSDTVDLAEAMEQAFAASPGNPMVLSSRSTADILAYAAPFEGLSILASDTGLEWVYHNGAWGLKGTQADSSDNVVAGWIFNG